MVQRSYRGAGRYADPPPPREVPPTKGTVVPARTLILIPQGWAGSPPGTLLHKWRACVITAGLTATGSAASRSAHGRRASGSGSLRAPTGVDGARGGCAWA